MNQYGAYSATLYFKSGNTRYEYGSADVIIRWAARYGVTLEFRSDTGPWVTAYPDNVLRLELDRL